MLTSHVAPRKAKSAEVEENGEASMREWGERKGEERERIKLV